MAGDQSVIYWQPPNLRPPRRGTYQPTRHPSTSTWNTNDWPDLILCVERTLLSAKILFLQPAEAGAGWDLPGEVFTLARRCDTCFVQLHNAAANDAPCRFPPSSPCSIHSSHLLPPLLPTNFDTFQSLQGGRRPVEGFLCEVGRGCNFLAWRRGQGGVSAPNPFVLSL